MKLKNNYLLYFTSFLCVNFRTEETLVRGLRRYKERWDRIRLKKWLTIEVRFKRK